MAFGRVQLKQCGELATLSIGGSCLLRRSKIVIPLEVLLVEIERRCSSPQCNARTRLGLTKNEARAYTGFECERCKQWNEDILSDRDVPEWWEEIAVTDLYAVRAEQKPDPKEFGEVIERMSKSYFLTIEEQ